MISREDERADRRKKRLRLSASVVAIQRVPQPDRTQLLLSCPRKELARVLYHVWCLLTACPAPGPRAVVVSLTAFRFVFAVFVAARRRTAF